MKSKSAWMDVETASGLTLAVATILALLAANSALQPTYEAFLAATLGPFTVAQWINDGLMGLFFFVVGQELKHELFHGALKSRARAIFPLIAAVGGMVVPAAIFLAFNYDSDAARGWGIPMATDIAFAVGVLTLFGRRISRELKVFLLALAIADDLGAVLVIATFYTSSLQLASFVSVGAVTLGFLIPRARMSPRLPGFVAFVVMPLFAFANAGLTLDGYHWSVLTNPLVLGIVIGLALGKPLGIFGFSVLVEMLGFAKRPAGITNRQLLGAAALGGIGFTMALFVSHLALATTVYRDYAKIGILTGSSLAAILGGTILLGSRRS